MQTLDDFINQVKSLPPAPQVLTRLLVVLNEDDAPASSVVDLVALDPALTAKILQRCNSAASGLENPVVDLHEAVTRLGVNAIYRMVALVVGEGMLSKEQKGYGIGNGGLWEHALTTAVSARVIARRTGESENLAFTAGLMHDIGKLVLSIFLEDSQAVILQSTGVSRHSFVETEQSLLGVHHAEIGGRLLTRWNFPQNIIMAVTHHHNPSAAKPHEHLASVVHLADIIAHYLGRAQGFDSYAIQTEADALEILGLNSLDLEPLVLDADHGLNEFNWLLPART
jgi:putative nucleotidyltransferase with HDIG domain